MLRVKAPSPIYSLHKTSTFSHFKVWPCHPFIIFIFRTNFYRFFFSYTTIFILFTTTTRANFVSSYFFNYNHLLLKNNLKPFFVNKTREITLPYSYSSNVFLLSNNSSTVISLISNTPLFFTLATSSYPFFYYYLKFYDRFL